MSRLPNVCICAARRCVAWHMSLSRMHLRPAVEKVTVSRRLPEHHVSQPAQSAFLESDGLHAEASDS